jgi:hypothetical protein
MKIFCLTCKKHVLDTTETFVCGGPYNGTMFVSAQGMPPYAKYPRHVGVVKKNLQCPWCSAPFLGVSDELLTEHGKIKAGQKTYDPEFSIVWQEGPAKGKLMYIKDAPESPEKIEQIDTVLENSFDVIDKQKEIVVQSEGDPRKLMTYELKDKGLNNSQIAKEVGVSGVTVGKWLKDRK